MNEITMTFGKNPSALLSLWKAFRTRETVYSDAVEYPVIHAVRPVFVINETHWKAFHEICDIERPSEYLHMLYPFTFVYPYIIRVMCIQEMPLSMFNMLNTRASITMHRGIRPDERLHIDCHNCAPRLVPKGLEIDVKSVITSGGEKVWENIGTYFYPGNFGPAEPSYSAPKLEPINGAPVVKEWYLPAKDRFRFARISGDRNGIHYESFYTRMMVYQRDFAQPIRTNGGYRFDLYCSGNDKPVICGMLNARNT